MNVMSACVDGVVGRTSARFAAGRAFEPATITCYVLK